jgi:hypothetical protein
VSAPCSFDYAVVRVVPHVDREEFVNAGVIVFCHERDLLVGRVELDDSRLRALSRDVDIDLVRRHLDAIPRICRGGPASGPVGRLALRERWHWLIAPRSTILQTSAPHSGLDDAPETLPDRLLDRVVRLRPWAPG